MLDDDVIEEDDQRNSYLEHLDGGARLAMLDDDVIEEDDLCDLHGDVILVGSRLQVAHHARPSQNIGSVEVPNRKINIWLIGSLLEYSPAVQGVGGSRPDRDLFVSGALVEDGDDLGQVSP
jgi:hypothetical protein